MKHLELHILQSFPVVCLNRDDQNSPKTAIFGAVQRARVSSQSWKRAIRAFAQQTYPSLYGGKRTRLLVAEIKKELSNQKCDGQRAHALAMCLGHYLAKIDPKNTDKVKTLMFFSPKENEKLSKLLLGLDVGDTEKLVDAFARVDIAALEKEDDSADDAAQGEASPTPKKKQKAADDKKPLSPKKFGELVGGVLKSPINQAFRGKDAVQVKDAADIALFGRMVANDHSLTVEGAAMFGHALSTHKVDNEIDFFSAVDDLQPEEESGAGMTGTLEFNSATYYRFAALNLGMLYDPNATKDERRGQLRSMSQEERQQVVRAFVEATLSAVPGARKNSMNAATLPGYVLGVVRRTGHPVQLVNAFEKPIRPFGGKGLFESSLDALRAERERLNGTWGLNEREAWSRAIPDVSLATFLDEVITYVD